MGTKSMKHALYMWNAIRHCWAEAIKIIIHIALAIIKFLYQAIDRSVTW